MNYERLTAVYAKQGAPVLPVKKGMQLEIHEKVGEGSTERVWRFKGLVIKVKKPNHPDGTFTIRGVASGVTIEKIYPLSFPKFEKVLLLDEFKARKSKLYYMRDKIGKDARLKSKITTDRRDADLTAESFVHTASFTPVVETKPAPEVVEEAAPEVVEEAAPEVVEEAAPEVVEEATPEVVGEATPEVVGEATPEE
ncbi:hypothetical protein AGMMS50249_7750 [candidate division SR1 bacterium]|nr:hypothetical protein AGMMS50249_7750 [candidate division SR1 bacterium]